MDMGNRAVKTWRGGEGLEGGGQSGGKWEMKKKKKSWTETQSIDFSWDQLWVVSCC